MLTRIRPCAAFALARRDLPTPLDVINVITTARFDRYQWYGLLVMPVMAAVGGHVRWMGRFERSLHGERQADKLLIVRYPSQRRFLAMTLNPYYLAINPLREAGVRRFEASFTHPSHDDPALHSRRLLVAVHFNSADAGALAAVRELIEPAAGELVYATRAVADLSIVASARETDPNPLSFQQLALFAPAGGELPEHDLDSLAAKVATVTDGCSVQVYRREPRSAYRPSLRRPAMAGAAAAG
ncbi:MAG: DUF1330 domain-containing protein [Actinomycetota bacterium]|nr:DUF1330 domain-containing protein [Actinomycetota bacterium]